MCRYTVCCVPNSQDLVRNTQLLEQHYKDMQDIEFTVQEGQLYMLQTRGVGSPHIFTMRSAFVCLSGPLLSDC